MAPVPFLNREQQLQQHMANFVFHETLDDQIRATDCNFCMEPMAFNTSNAPVPAPAAQGTPFYVDYCGNGHYFHKWCARGLLLRTGRLQNCPDCNAEPTDAARISIAESYPMPGAPAPAAPAAPPGQAAPAAPALPAAEVSEQTAWQDAATAAGLGTGSGPFPAGYPLTDQQKMIMSSMVTAIKDAVRGYGASSANEPTAMELHRNHLNNGVYGIFKLNAANYVGSDASSGLTRLNELDLMLDQLMSLFIMQPDGVMPEHLQRAILIFLSGFMQSDGTMIGLLPNADDRDRLERFQSAITTWERLNATLRLADDRPLQFAVDALLGRDPVVFADPVDSNRDALYLRPTDEEREWGEQQTGMDAGLHGSLQAVLRALPPVQAGGTGFDSAELLRALDAVPFPLPTDTHNRRNPWSLIFASGDPGRVLANESHPQTLIQLLMQRVVLPTVPAHVKLMICAFLKRFVAEYPEIGRNINTKNVHFRHRVRELAARLFRQVSSFAINTDHLTAAYELAAYLQVDHEDKWLSDGVERAVSTSLSGALNGAVRRAERHLRDTNIQGMASHLRAYQQAWYDERRLHARIRILWRAFTRRAVMRPDVAQDYVLPYLRTCLHNDSLLTVTGESRGSATTKLLAWIERPGRALTDQGTLAARGIIDDLNTYFEQLEESEDDATRARPEGEATPGRRRQRTL